MTSSPAWRSTLGTLSRSAPGSRRASAPRLLPLHPCGEACRCRIGVPGRVSRDHRQRVGAAAKLGAEGRDAGCERTAVEAAHEGRSALGCAEREGDPGLLLAGLYLRLAGDRGVGGRCVNAERANRRAGVLVEKGVGCLDRECVRAVSEAGGCDGRRTGGEGGAVERAPEARWLLAGIEFEGRGRVPGGPGRTGQDRGLRWRRVYEERASRGARVLVEVGIDRLDGERVWSVVEEGGRERARAGGVGTAIDAALEGRAELRRLELELWSRIARWPVRSGEDAGVGDAAEQRRRYEWEELVETDISPSAVAVVHAEDLARVTIEVERPRIGVCRIPDVDQRRGGCEVEIAATDEPGSQIGLMRLGEGGRAGPAARRQVTRDHFVCGVVVRVTRRQGGDLAAVRLQL